MLRCNALVFITTALNVMAQTSASLCSKQRSSALSLRNWLPHYLEKYTTKTPAALREELHYKNIAALIQFACENEPGILRERGYKYGVTQTLLNLILNIFVVCRYHFRLRHIVQLTVS